MAGKKAVDIYHKNENILKITGRVPVLFGESFSEGRALVYSCSRCSYHDIFHSIAVRKLPTIRDTDD